ncbi:conserved exported hypothetical protein [Gammaproteobacteria bacterium]
MKLIILAMVFIVSLLQTKPVTAQVNISRNYAAFLGVLDTLTNADTTTYIVSITGKKAHLAVSADVTKITGTVSAKMYVYGSVNGTTYITTPIDSLVTSDNTGLTTYKYTMSDVPYQKLKFQWRSTATQSLSQRTYLLYRE